MKEESSNTKKNGKQSVTEALECGTSLAEQEFSEESAPAPSASNNNAEEESDHDNKDGIWRSIDQLRDQIARDVLTASNGKSDSLTSFASPFQAPTTAANNKSRYLQLPLVYCDQTASNRPVESIERYMEETCLPLYGNTHTNTSITGSQSTAFVAEARQIVGEETNARITGKASLDVVLFAGSGTTAAVELLIDCLGIQHACGDFDKRPVVFVGPYEHHSNLIPWRESGCEIVMVPECPKTKDVDILKLERLLQESIYDNRLKMGTFTAASNVTGKIANVDRIAATLHRHGALAFFDYATGAPYMKMDMNPAPSAEYPTPSLVSKDAIFFSPHKMIGGVGTPGVLIVKKHLVNQVNAPSRSGGGTVFYVTNTHHRFLSNRIERYEGGTPNVLGIVRVGLAFLLKRQAEQQYLLLHSRNKEKLDNSQPNQHTAPPPTLQSLEILNHKLAVEYLLQNAPNLVLLGDSDRESLPIFSFLIKCGKRFLHFNYVCAILNDLFGIQSRGGCQCSGPYSQRLLGLAETKEDGSEAPNALNEQIEHALLHFKERAELLRPGYTRLSLPFKGLRKEEVEYVLKALAWTSKYGWALMCNYRCNHRTGEWRHFNRQGKPLGRHERKWLSHYSMAKSPKSVPQETCSEVLPVEETLNDAFVDADRILQAAKCDQRSIMQALKMNDTGNASESDLDSLEKLRWFVYPKECATYLSEGLLEVPGTQSDGIMGALRPSGFTCMEDADCDGGDSNLEAPQRKGEVPVIDEPMEDACTASERKRKPLHTPETARVKGDKARKSSSGNSTDLIPFRDGEHSGEALLEDIANGFDDGELSEKCEVFDAARDAWVAIETFFAERKKSSTTTETKEGNTSDPQCMESSQVPAQLSFRDGQHSGEAPLEEIEAGYDDGELSNGCEIFEKETGTWVAIEPFLGARKQTKSPSNSNGLNDRQMPQQQRENDGSDSKNEKKKPSRGDAAWGQGQFQPPGLPSESTEKVEATKAVSAADGVQNSGEAPKGKKKFRHIKPPAKLMRQITQAMIQWNMVEDGDRLLLGLSGGKDSLSLLHCLMEFQRKLPIKFEIEVCTIDPMTPSFDPSPLIPYVESLGLKYHYIRDDIVARANSAGKDGSTVSSLCAFCARMKRGNLYTCARKNNCNKLVLAQHLDDCAESFMMSVMHNGFLRTMKANYQINAGDLSVIRPLVYCRESLMTNFAKSNNLPVINENCPACFEEPKERARIKKLLAREEAMYPHFHDNIKRSIIPLMHDDMTGILRCYTEEAVSKSRKVPYNGKDKKGKNKNVATVESLPAVGSVEGSSTAPGGSKLLCSATEDELLMELARRKAAAFRLSGAMGRNNDDDADPTGQVCSLNGGNGTIPCRELME